MEWLPILSQPLTQLGGVLGILFALQKAGIIDLKAATQRFFNTAETRGNVDFDNRTVLQDILLKIENLTQYANHETTEQLKRLNDGMEKMHEKMDESNQILKAIDKYGVRCHKE